MENNKTIETSNKSIDILTFKPEPDSKVHMYPLNPKSITPRLLYGDVDEATNEW